MLLLCELCPAAYHYVCAGYYDAAGVGSTHLSTVPAADLLLPLLAALTVKAVQTNAHCPRPKNVRIVATSKLQLTCLSCKDNMPFYFSGLRFESRLPTQRKRALSPTSSHMVNYRYGWKLVSVGNASGRRFVRIRVR